MVSGGPLLGAAAAAAALALCATGWTLVGGRRGRAGQDARWRQVAHIGSWGAFVLTAATTLHLLLLLATADFSVRYVWQHTATTEAALRRMSALLAGQEGSFLVWALLAAGVAAWTAWRWHRGDARTRGGSGVVHLATAGIALMVLLLALASAPFQSFAEAFPTLDVRTAPVEGRGLNPVLANPWMPPHTLLTFVSYALLGLAFGIALSQLREVAQGRAAGARQWQPLLRQVTRWAWLVLTAALLTGVVWAYEEMTFGWFWSWDPVEAATLSIWLLAAAALHALAETGSSRRHLVVAPALAAVAFVAVVFASFVTRSGLHPSVHAFASGAVGRWVGVALVVLAVVVAGLTLAAWRAAPAGPARQPWLFWAVWPLLAAAGLITWGLGYPMGATLLDGAADLDTGFFTLWGALVAVLLLLLMGFGLQMSLGRRSEALSTLAFFVVLTVVAAAVKPVGGLEFASPEGRAAAGGLEALLGRSSVLVFLPPAVYALLAVGERWWASRTGASRRARLAQHGSALIHLGAVATVVGVTFATVLATTVTVGVDPATRSGAAEGVQVRLVALDRSEHSDATGTVTEAREVATVEVRNAAGLLAAGEASLSTYPERDMGRHARVLVERGLGADTQVIFHGLAEVRPDGVPVTVRRIPLVNLVWGGLVLLLIGMGLVTGARCGPAAAPATRPQPREPRERRAPLAAPRGAA